MSFYLVKFKIGQALVSIYTYPNIIIKLACKIFNCSSEGWRESTTSAEESPDEEIFRPVSDKMHRSDGAFLTVDSKTNSKRDKGGTYRGSSRSIVLLEVGRETVEHWARFAKKASI